MPYKLQIEVYKGDWFDFDSFLTEVQCSRMASFLIKTNRFKEHELRILLDGVEIS